VTADGGLLASPDHLVAVAVTAVLCIGVVVAARTRPGGWTPWFSRGLAAFLAGWFVADQLYRIARGTWDVETNLPLELTDAVTLIAALALLGGGALVFELTYFWGLTGSLQATLTPALDADEGFPGFYYWSFFAIHGGVVLAATFLAFGLRMTPRPGAVRRVFAVTLAWAALVGAADLVTGGNYMYLREKPDTASLLDYLGPWPLYLVAAAAVALAMFALLDLPFRRRRRRAASGETRAHLY